MFLWWCVICSPNVWEWISINYRKETPECRSLLKNCHCTGATEDATDVLLQGPRYDGARHKLYRATINYTLYSRSNPNIFLTDSSTCSLKIENHHFNRSSAVQRVLVIHPLHKWRGWRKRVMNTKLLTRCKNNWHKNDSL